MMLEYRKVYLYRMTHIRNMPHILQYGITHSSSPNANVNFVPIGDSSLITTRACKLLKSGNRLGDYIPFYFGTRMPMLYVIQKGYNAVKPTPGKNIVYCVTSVQKILDAKLDFQFTDGHAVDSFSTQFGVDDVVRIEEIIDKEAVNSKFWKKDDDLDLKRRMEAEFLVLGDIPESAILGYIVYNQEAKDELIGLGLKENRITVRPQAYF